MVDVVHRVAGASGARPTDRVAGPSSPPGANAHVEVNPGSREQRREGTGPRWGGRRRGRGEREPPACARVGGGTRDWLEGDRSALRRFRTRPDSTAQHAIDQVRWCSGTSGWREHQRGSPRPVGGRCQGHKAGNEYLLGHAQLVRAPRVGPSGCCWRRTRCRCGSTTSESTSNDVQW